MSKLKLLLVLLKFILSRSVSYSGLSVDSSLLAEADASLDMLRFCLGTKTRQCQKAEQHQASRVGG